MYDGWRCEPDVPAVKLRSVGVRHTGGIIGKLGAGLRGLLGLGAVGGLLGALGGAIWTLGVTLVRLGTFVDVGFWSYVASHVLSGATMWGLLGAFTGTAFGSLLMLAESRRSLDQLPLWRMALFGALAGAAFVPVFIGVRFGLATLVDGLWTLLPTMGLVGTFGAVFATSLVSIAQRAHRAELSLVEEAAALLEGEATLE